MKMPNTMTVIKDDAQFDSELDQIENRIIVVFFHSSVSESCQLVSPTFRQLAMKYYMDITFFKVDFDQCKHAAIGQGVAATDLPMFGFYRNKIKLDMYQGTDPYTLEYKINKHYSDYYEDSDGEFRKVHITIE